MRAAVRWQDTGFRGCCSLEDPLEGHRHLSVYCGGHDLSKGCGTHEKARIEMRVFDPVGLSRPSQKPPRPDPPLWLGRGIMTDSRAMLSCNNADRVRPGFCFPYFSPLSLSKRMRGENVTDQSAQSGNSSKERTSSFHGKVIRQEKSMGSVRSSREPYLWSPTRGKPREENWTRI